jgi:hypothetical protein
VQKILGVIKDLWIHESNLVPQRCFGLTEVDSDEEEEFLGGKRPTKKYKGKSKKTRQRKLRTKRRK